VIQLVALSMLGLTATCYADEPTKASAEENNATSEETNFLPDMLSKSHFDRDFSASVGLRLWQNKWNLPRWNFSAQYPREVIEAFRDDVIISSNSSNTSTDIPAIGLRYKNFGRGAYCGDIIGEINEQRRQRNEMLSL